MKNANTTINTIVTGAIVLAVARSLSKSKENQEKNGRSLSHKPTVLDDFKAVCPNMPELAEKEFKDYIAKVNQLHKDCFKLARDDRGSAVNKAIAEFINGVMGSVGHITAGSFAITRVAAKTVKDVCTSFDKSSGEVFRRAVEVCLFNCAVEYQYSDTASLDYFKARIALERNTTIRETTPARITMLKNILSKLKKDTAEYKDVENQLKGAERSFDIAEKAESEVTKAFNEATAKLDESVKAGSNSMLVEILNSAEHGLTPSTIATNVVEKLSETSKADKASKAEKKSA